jgi:hypothetical protein
MDDMISIICTILFKGKTEEPVFEYTVHVGGTFFGCVDQCDGELRFVLDSATCEEDEVPVTWNVNALSSAPTVSSAPSSSSSPSIVPSTS